MSLEELRAQAEAEETKAEQPEAEADEPEQEEPEQEETEEPEAEEAEESDDFELELEGEPEPDQQKYDPVEVLQHKLSRERKKKQKARSEVDELKEQISRLTEMMQGGQQQPQQAAPQAQSAAEPKIPDLYDSGIDGDRDKYDRAMKKWFQDYQAYQNRHQQAEQAQNQNRERFESMTKELATRAAKFASEHKVSVDRVADALDKATSEVDEATGIEGALAYLLDSVGDGSERVAYYIGTNNGAMSQIKGLLKDDPQGFKAIAHMTRLAEKLKPKHSRKVSKAPEPDQPLRGDSSKSSPSAKKVQDMWDKAKTPDEMMAARRKARELGVQLNT